MIDAEQDESSEEGHEEACGLTRFVVAYGASKEGSEKRTGNADQHSNEDAAGIFPWHDELGNRTHDKTYKGRPKQTQHICSSVLSFPGLPDPSRLMGKEYSYSGLMQGSGGMEVAIFRFIEKGPSDQVQSGVELPVKRM
jgi:hypothetical protein